MDQEPGTSSPDAGAQCRYIEEWVAIKTAWALTIDADEKADLQQFANLCP